MMSKGNVKRLIALLFSSFFVSAAASAGQNSHASTCRIGGVYVMVFGGAMSGNGGAKSLQAGLSELIGTSYAGSPITWQVTGDDYFDMKTSLENVLGDLEPENPSLSMAVSDIGSFLGGGLTSETGARDVALPVIGEFFANSKKSESGALRVADNAYQQLAAEIRTGKRVLLIAHSDGAFAMQATYDRLVQDFGTDHVGRYGIAPLTPGGSYIAASSDSVVNAVVGAGGSATIKGNVATAASAVDLFNHSPAFYIGAKSTLRSRIKTEILSVLSGLKGAGSPVEGGLVSFSSKPLGNFFVGLTVIPPPNGLGLGAPDVREIRPGVYEYTSVLPCNTPPAWAGKYTVTIRFAGGAKPGDEAQVSVTAPGRGTQTIRVKAPICKECVEYDSNGKLIQVVDEHKEVVVTAVQVSIAADGTASTSDKSPAFGIDITSPNRMTWKQSEVDVGKEYNDVNAANPKYEKEQSFLKGFKQAGAGSVRPDWYQYNLPAKFDNAVEVKNYDLKKNRSNLLSKLKDQLGKRVANLPLGAIQTVHIELRGQTCTATDIAKLKSDLLAQNPSSLKSAAQIRTIGQCN